MFKWIYGHHKVQYQYHVLNKFIKRLCETKDLGKVFSFKAITGKPVDFDGFKISYTDDHDLWYIFKNADLPQRPFKILRDQLFNRNHYKPFWKTRIEFDELKKPFDTKIEYIVTQLADPDSFFERKIKPKIPALGVDDILIFKHDPKVVFPNLSSNMYFYLENKSGEIVVKEYGELFGPENDSDSLRKLMFHIFINKEKYSVGCYNQVIDVLKNL